MNHLKKFTKNSGQIIRHYEIFIPKNGGKIETSYDEISVLLSSGNNVCVCNKYSKLQLLDIKKTRGGNNSSVIGNPHAYVRNWGGGLLDYNGLVASIYTYQKETTCKKRVHNAIKKLIVKEYGAYGSMLDKLELFLNK